MNITTRIRQASWLLLIGCFAAAFLALTFKVNAVKGQVRLTERHIIAAQNAKLMLETEFQSRASQRQLADWNAVEFGYGAPRADQYLEGERQLAALGSPRGRNAPDPVRTVLARADTAPRDTSVLGELIEDADTLAQTMTAMTGSGDQRVAALAVQPGEDGALARRLARPALGMVAVTEVGQ